MCTKNMISAQQCCLVYSGDSFSRTANFCRIISQLIQVTKVLMNYELLHWLSWLRRTAYNREVTSSSLVWSKPSIHTATVFFWAFFLINL